MSDNGGLSTLPKNWKSPTSVLPLRAGKGWLYEGGIREPMIIKWHGVTQPNSVCDVPVISTDFFPTMLEMAGLPLKPGEHQDGKSLTPLLREKGGFSRDAIFWHYPHYHDSGNKPSAAVRAGNYKLIEWFEDGSVELYNLKDDIGEKNNLAEKMPEKTAQLKKMLHTWQIEMGALMPRENPDWSKE